MTEGTTQTPNIELWNRVNRPPAMALEPIKAGRLVNKTSINPQWRLEMLTREFGPQGIGWRYTIEDLWTTPGAVNGKGEVEVIAHARINLYVKIDGEWSEGIPGIGGKVMVRNESGGQYSNDEAYKMAVTDSISVAVKGLGFAADVYYNLWDGDKYRDLGADEGEVARWKEKCIEAAEGPVSQFKGWWPRNKEAVIEDCGEEGASFVWEFYNEKLKEVRHAED